MADVSVDRYLAMLPEARRAELAQVNATGLSMLRDLLDKGEAIAFLGAGASYPLYPLWGEVISRLVDRSAGYLTDDQASTCRVMAPSRPDAVVEIVRQHLGTPQYREVLREVFEVRRDPVTGRTWTPTHELVARCNFGGVVTTNYDPGIVNARMAVRSGTTGFTTWTDEDALDRWRRGDVFGDEELPVLYAHGHHNKPEAMVLATTEYRRAYGGKLARVLSALVDAGRLVWIGFSFADQRIAAILREIAEESGTRIDPGQAPRHVALMPWDPGGGADGLDAHDPGGGADGLDAHDPGVLRKLSEIQFGSHVVLYPAPGDDHSALQLLLEDHVDPRFAPAAPTGVPVPAAKRTAPAAARPGSAARADSWVHGGTPVEHFTGREEELGRLERWAADHEVRLIGVTAWGGAGKTALVTEWLTRFGGARDHGAFSGVFAWSFFEDPSSEAWATALADWVERTFGRSVRGDSTANRAVAAARSVPLVLVLDGLEVVQEGPAGTQFGRLLDGTLRDALTQLCASPGDSLVVLTSRFPFADLEQFDGSAARMLDVPPLTEAEGSALLQRSGGGWLSDAHRVELVIAVDGHALAVAVLAGALADRPPTADLRSLLTDLKDAPRTDTRVGRVLAFYADRLSDADQDLVAVVSLFQRPVRAAMILTLGRSDAFVAPLAGWTATDVEIAVRQRLSGLLSWHPDRTVSAHPLVREAFRPRLLSPAGARLAAETALSDLPTREVRSRDEALRVVEMIELLLDAELWQAADDMYKTRTNGGKAWKHLPAARLGERCSAAFAGTPARAARCRTELSVRRQGFYVNGVGLFAMQAGDMRTAERFLRASCDIDREVDDRVNLAISLRNLAECLWTIGQADAGRAAAEEAFALHQGTGPPEEMYGHVYLAVSYALVGDTNAAERHFIAADIQELEVDAETDHLYSARGCWWADFLIRTGRGAIARRLTERNRELSEKYGWNENVASCDVILARCDIGHGDVILAGTRLDVATATFREGDQLPQLALALVERAEQRRCNGEIDAAEQEATEAILLASPRELVPTHAAALAARARARGDLYATTGDADALARARDDADLSLRLATKIHRLPWPELDALAAHARLDGHEGRDRGWAAKAEHQRAVLIPPELDPDPLATAEARVARQDEA